MAFDEVTAQLLRENRELRELLREAGEIIEPMARWFRDQPLGAPPAGTAQLQENIRKVLATSGVLGTPEASDGGQSNG